MQAIQFFKQGGPEVLQIKDIPQAVPKDAEVLVQVEFAGINYADIYQRNAQNPASLPCIPGAEGAGIVVQGNQEYPEGSRVAWISHPASYAEYIAIPSWKLIALPDDISCRDAAAALLQAVTVQYLSESSYRVQAGDTVLLHAGAGGVGLLLTQVLKHKGATVISTVSNADKAALSLAAGADHVINYRDTDFVSVVKQIAPQGVHAVYDSVGLHTYLGSMAVLRPLGSLVLFGQSSGSVPALDPMALCRAGSLFFTRPTLVHHVADASSLDCRSKRALSWLREGILRLRIHAIYPLEQAAQAHADLESRSTTGKLLLAVSAAAKASISKQGQQ